MLFKPLIPQTELQQISGYSSLGSIIEEAFQYPLGPLLEVRALFLKLNLRFIVTGYDFKVVNIGQDRLWPQKDNKVARQLDKHLPRSIKRGKDRDLSVYQIYGRQSQDMFHHIPFLTALTTHQEDNPTFVLPNDISSQTNWQSLQEWDRILQKPGIHGSEEYINIVSTLVTKDTVEAYLKNDESIYIFPFVKKLKGTSTETSITKIKAISKLIEKYF